MFSGPIRNARALVAALALLTGVAILPGGTAAGDPSQDDKFLTLLGYEDIPAIDNATSLIDTAHKVCSKLDGGMSVNDLVDLIRNNGYNANWRSRLDPPDRVTRTINRFITAAVQAYCPYDEGKIASIASYPGTRSSAPTFRVTAYTRKAVDSGRDRGNRSDRDAHGLVLASLIGTAPSGEIPPTNPLPIPAKPPPAPQEVQPAPQQPPPPPRRVHPVPQQAPPQPRSSAGTGSGPEPGAPRTPGARWRPPRVGAPGGARRATAAGRRPGPSAGRPDRRQ